MRFIATSSFYRPNGVLISTCVCDSVFYLVLFLTTDYDYVNACGIENYNDNK